MESGRFASVAELAAAEKIHQSYLCRVLRLTLVAPEIVQAILDGRQVGCKLDALMRPFPVNWTPQVSEFIAGEALVSSAPRLGLGTPMSGAQEVTLAHVDVAAVIHPVEYTADAALSQREAGATDRRSGAEYQSLK